MKRITKYFVIARVSFMNAIAYRAAAFSRFGFYTLFIYVFMSLWRAIYSEGSVHGYGYAQIVWYLIMTELIAFGSGRGVFSDMSQDIKNGSIAYQLGRPTHYVFYQFANSMGQVSLNMLSFGALACALGLLFVGPLTTFSLSALPALALSVALSLLLNFFILMLIGLSAFIMEDNFALYLIYQKMCFMLGMFLPVEFLPEWLQPVAKSLPFSYVFWAPAKIFVSYSPELFWELVPRQAGWAIAAISLTLACYRLSIRRLQVNGG